MASAKVDPVRNSFPLNDAGYSPSGRFAPSCAATSTARNDRTPYLPSSQTVCVRKEYDFSNGERNKYASRFPRRPKWPIPVEDDSFTLTAAQRRELDRRVKDAKDRNRFLLVSQISDRFTLYYSVSDDAWVANDPTYATLFKREKAAGVVKRLLGSSARIVRCRVDTRGRLVLTSVPLPMRRRRRLRRA